MRFWGLIEEMRPDISIACLADNRLQGEIRGLPVHQPSELDPDDFDIILLASAHQDEMLPQVTQLSRPIWSVDEDIYRFEALRTRRRLCIIHANCQGETLREMLLRCKSFSQSFYLVSFPNFSGKPPSPEVLGRCLLFAHQRIDPKWGASATAVLETYLPPECRKVVLPKLSWRVFWPFSTDHLQHGLPPIAGHSVGDVGLIDLLRRGVPPEKAAQIYADTDFAKITDLDALLEGNLAYLARRDNAVDVDVSDEIKGTFRRRKPFNGIRHPVHAVLFRIRDAVLQAAGCPVPDNRAHFDLPELASRKQIPIHPSVACHFGLAYGSEHEVYALGDRQVTYSQWLREYAAALHAGGCFSLSEEKAS